MIFTSTVLCLLNFASIRIITGAARKSISVQIFEFDMGGTADLTRHGLRMFSFSSSSFDDVSHRQVVASHDEKNPIRTVSLWSISLASMSLNSLETRLYCETYGRISQRRIGCDGMSANGNWIAARKGSKFINVACPIWSDTFRLASDWVYLPV